MKNCSKIHNNNLTSSKIGADISIIPPSDAIKIFVPLLNESKSIPIMFTKISFYIPNEIIELEENGTVSTIFVDLEHLCTTRRYIKENHPILNFYTPVYTGKTRSSSCSSFQSSSSMRLIKKDKILSKGFAHYLIFIVLFRIFLPLLCIPPVCSTF